MAQVFISYSRSDLPIALRVALALEEQGYTTWYYSRDNSGVIGMDYDTRIVEAIEEAPMVCFVLSREGAVSEHVKREASLAIEKNKQMAAILNDLTRDQLLECDKSWAYKLGAGLPNSLLEKSLEQIIENLVDTFIAKDIHPSDRALAEQGAEGTRALLSELTQSDRATRGKSPSVQWQAPRPSRARLSEARRRRMIGLMVALVIVLTGAVAVLLFVRTAESGTGFVELNDGLITHQTGAQDIASVTTDVNWAPQRQIEQSLHTQKIRPTATDLQVMEDADQALKRQSFDAAKTGYQNLLTRFPNTPEIHINHSVLLELTGEFDDAIRELRDLEARRSKQVVQAAIQTNLGVAYLHKRDFRSAQESFSAAMKNDLKNAAASNGLGAALYTEGKYREAADHFKQAVAQNPRASTLKVNLAAALLDQGDLSAARKCIETVEQSGLRSAQSQAVLGRIYLRQGKPTEAREAFAVARQLHENRADLYYNAAKTWIGLNADSAEAYFSYARRLAPGYQEVAVTAPGPSPAEVPVSEKKSAATKTTEEPPAAFEISAPPKPDNPKPETEKKSTPNFTRVPPVYLGLRLVPLDGGAAREIKVDAVTVFDTETKARQFRDCSGSYEHVTISEKGRLKGWQNPHFSCTQPDFQRLIESWLGSYRLAPPDKDQPSSAYEARIELILVIVR